MTLLSLLLKLKKEFDIKIYVAHVNHMIRENANIDEIYVKEFCEKNGLEIYIKHIDILKEAKKSKKGIEETGRSARYKFFDEILEKTNSNKIAIAHNLNDKAETILMNLIRGTGTSGLKGIEPRRGKYIRPLIEISREKIEQYCEEMKINPRHDESNDDNTYTRNKIRNIVIPYLKENFNPNIVTNLNRLSEIIKEEEEFFEKQALRFFEEIAITNTENIIEYNVRKFNNLDKVIQKRLILEAIKMIKGSTQGIEKINLDDIIKLCNNNIGNKYLLPTKGLKIGIKNKKIFIKKIS